MESDTDCACHIGQGRRRNCSPYRKAHLCAPYGAVFDVVRATGAGKTGARQKTFLSDDDDNQLLQLPLYNLWVSSNSDVPSASAIN
eukprot:1480368-Amphidinium_carterae.1